MRENSRKLYLKPLISPTKPSSPVIPVPTSLTFLSTLLTLLLTPPHGGEHVLAAVTAVCDEGAAAVVGGTERVHGPPALLAAPSDRHGRLQTERRRGVLVWALCAPAGREGEGRGREGRGERDAQ